MSNSKVFAEAKAKAMSEAELLLAEQSDKVMPWMAEKFGPELAAAQIQLESEGLREGIDKFFERLESKIGREEASQAAPFKNLVSHTCEKLSEKLAEWMEYQTTKVRRKHVAVGLMQGNDMYNIAFVSISTLLNQYAATVIGRDEPYVLQAAINDIGRAVEDEIRFGKIRDAEAAQFHKYVKPNLDKRIGQEYKKAYLSKVEDDLANRKLLDEWDKWPAVQAYNVGLVIVDMLSAVLGMFTLETKYRTTAASSAIQHLVMADEWQTALINTSANNAMMVAMRQPCVIPPKSWTSPIGGGYYLKGKKPLLFLRTRNRQSIERLFDVHMPEVYEAVNIAQKTAWKINPQVLEVAQAVYAQEHTKLEAMPQREPLALPDRPVLGDEATDEEWKAWKKEAAEIYRIEGARKSKRMALNTAIQSAAKYLEYAEIYFPYNLDWRGRVNAVSTFNPQGSDMTKGLLTFAEGEAIGAEGIKWLAIHGASRGGFAGMDKANLKDAEQWVYDNEALILDIAENPLDNTTWQEADEPFCFLAFCFEWAQVKIHGESFKSSLPLAFDGSCSGIQHFSCMLRDEVGGAAVNLIPSEVMNDIYKLVSDKVNAKVQADTVSGTQTERTEEEDKDGNTYFKTAYGTLPLAVAWATHGIGRNEAKRPTMTLPYGSGKYGFTDQILEDTVQPAIDSGRGSMFLDAENKMPAQACRYLASHMWDALGETVTKSVEAMAWLQHVAGLLSATIRDRKTKEILRGALPIFWTTPDGFPVWHEYRKPVTVKIDCMLFSGTRYQVKEVPTDEFTIDGAKQRSGISPNFVHSLDATHLRKTVVHARRKYGIKSFHLIHDSFGTTAAQAGNLFRAVREQLVDTYEHNDVLGDFRDQFLDQLHETQVDKLKEIPARGTLDLQGILESEFCFR